MPPVGGCFEGHKTKALQMKGLLKSKALYLRLRWRKLVHVAILTPPPSM